MENFEYMSKGEIYSNFGNITGVIDGLILDVYTQYEVHKAALKHGYKVLSFAEDGIIIKKITK